MPIVNLPAKKASKARKKKGTGKGRKKGVLTAAQRAALMKATRASAAKRRGRHLKVNKKKADFWARSKPKKLG